MFELKEIQRYSNVRIELNTNQDIIEDDDIQTNQNITQWVCYLCANPDKFSDLFDQKPLIQGQLKEKHGKWKFLRRWHKRIFTLAGGSIVYFKKDMVLFYFYYFICQIKRKL